MRIQYYMQFFPGADAVGSLQPITLCTLLADRGHDVTVISTDYNIDTNLPEKPHSYRSPSGGSLEVLRLHSPRGGRDSLKQRLRSYLAFMETARRAGMELPKPDVVVGSIQPMFTGRSAMKVAKARNVPFLLEVRDLWPDALEVKGAVTGWKAKLLHHVVNGLYAGADRIVSITPGIKTELLKKPHVKVPVDIFPNGFDPRLFEGGENRRDEMRAKFNFGDKFVAIYTGAHTVVTALPVTVLAAKELQRRKDIAIHVFGQGPTKAEVMTQAAELGLSNIQFHDSVPKADIPGLLAAADVALMTLFKTPLIHIYFQNKFMDYLGSGKPIFGAIEGEQAAIIARAGAGKTVPLLDHHGFAKLIEWGADHREELVEMGKRGRDYVYKHLLLTYILERYAEAIEATARGEGATYPVWEPGIERS